MIYLRRAIERNWWLMTAKDVEPDIRLELQWAFIKKLKLFARLMGGKSSPVDLQIQEYPA